MLNTFEYLLLILICVIKSTGISVKNEDDDPEINAMALKMKESYQKSATATLRQGGTPTANVYINRAGRQVALPLVGASLPNSATKENVEKISKDCEDALSIKGQYTMFFCVKPVYFIIFIFIHFRSFWLADYWSILHTIYCTHNKW